MERNPGKAVFITAIIAGIIIALTGCNVNGVTSGYGAVTLAVQGTLPAGQTRTVGARAVSSPIEFPVTDSSGVEVGTLYLTETLVALDEIEFELPEEEIDTEEEIEQSEEIEFPGPFIVDLLANTVTPEIDTTEIVPGTYEKIELDLHKITGDETEEDGTTQLVETNDPLFGNSIYILGTYTGLTSSGSVTDMAFELSFDLDEEFELTGTGDQTGGLVIDEGIVNDIIIAFRLARWFQFDNGESNPDGVDFSQLVTVSDGEGGFEIILDESVTGDNEKIRQVIKENIKESADYGEDDDEDGELGSDEDDDPESEDEDDT